MKRRIAQYYHRESTIIYPPVDVQKFTVGAGDASYFITGGRLTYYKRFDITVDAFSKMNIPLIVYGDGPERARLEKRAKPNVTFVGRVSEEKLRSLYQHAIAFINPQVEDFGITMVEAMASGRPVIAYQAGGALDIIEDGVSGLFFDEQSWEALADTVIRFEKNAFDPKKVRASSERFSREAFEKNIKQFLQEKQLIT